MAMTAYELKAMHQQDMAMCRLKYDLYVSKVISDQDCLVTEYEVIKDNTKQLEDNKDNG